MRKGIFIAVLSFAAFTIKAQTNRNDLLENAVLFPTQKYSFNPAYAGEYNRHIMDLNFGSFLISGFNTYKFRIAYDGYYKKTGFFLFFSGEKNGLFHKHFAGIGLNYKFEITEDLFVRIAGQFNYSKTFVDHYVFTDNVLDTTLISYNNHAFSFISVDAAFLIGYKHFRTGITCRNLFRKPQDYLPYFNHFKWFNWLLSYDLILNKFRITPGLICQIGRTEPTQQTFRLFDIINTDIQLHTSIEWNERIFVNLIGSTYKRMGNDIYYYGGGFAGFRIYDRFQISLYCYKLFFIGYHQPHVGISLKFLLSKKQ